MRPRYSLARRRAQQLLADGGVTEAPVPLERLAELCRATIRYEPFDGEVSGMVHCRPGGGGVIGVNSEHSKTRQRFTIAHELGHLLLHADEEFHIDEKRPLALRDEVSSQAIDPREIEANQFAAELLMPAALVRESVGTLVEKDAEVTVEEAVEELARAYRVSEIAMTHRLTSLKIIGSDDDVAG
jgi:Zn-dependent peptidase ImmA (M78 family)